MATNTTASTTAKTTAKKSAKATTKTSAKATTKVQAAKVTKAKKEIVEAVDAVEEVVEATSKSVFAKVSSNIERVQGVAKQVWLANLGAAGRTYEEAVSLYEKAGDELQSRYSKLNKGGQDLVEDLVSRGEKVQDEAETRLKEGRATVEEQIEVAKERLVGLTSVVDIPARLQDLSNKLESLSKDLKKSA